MRSWIEKTGDRFVLHLSLHEVWMLLEGAMALLTVSACQFALFGHPLEGGIVLALALGIAYCRERAYRAPDAG